jgi:hypothetical protein
VHAILTAMFRHFGRALKSPALAIVLILVPLVITAVFHYLPVLTERQKISDLAVMHPRFIGPKEFTYLQDDVAKRLHTALAAPALRLRDLPPPDSQAGGDLLQQASEAGANAVLVPTLTVDAGIVQLNLQVIETRTAKVIFNTPYQSSMKNYPDMIRAAGAALKRSLP